MPNGPQADREEHRADTSRSGQDAVNSFLLVWMGSEANTLTYKGHTAVAVLIFRLMSWLTACLQGAELPPATAFTDEQKEGLPGKEARKERHHPFGFKPQCQVLKSHQIVKEIN